MFIIMFKPHTGKECPLGNQIMNRPVIVSSNVRELRMAASLSQEAAAERFNLSLRVWQMKVATKNHGLLSQGEYELLLLLAGRHPFYTVIQNARK